MCSRFSDIITRVGRGIQAPRPTLTTSNLERQGHVMAAHQDTTFRRCGKCGEVRPLKQVFFRTGTERSWVTVCHECRIRQLDENTEVRWCQKYLNGCGVMTPHTQILDEAGRDWSWAFVIYRELDEYPGCCIGSDGTIWSCRTSDIRGRMSRWFRLSAKPISHFGHLGVSVVNASGKRVTKQVHSLVLTAFRGPRPFGKQSCHYPDRDPSNNNLRNLRWGTSAENSADMFEHGTDRVRGETSPVAKINDLIVMAARCLRRDGWKYRDIAKLFNISESVICNCFNGKSWAHVTMLRPHNKDGP